MPHRIGLLLLGSGLTSVLAERPLVALGVLFGAGVATSLTPCIYPMIPITVAIIAPSAGAGAGAVPSRRRAAQLTLVYVLGLALFYALLGLLAGLTGSLFGSVSSHPWALFAMGNLLLVFGLAMLDVIPIAAPERLAAWAGRLAGGSVPAVFLLGATSGIVAAPCGAPAFAVVLTWVATTRSALLGFVYLFVFSLGMTALLFVAGVFSGTLAALPRPGRWTVGIKKAAGVVILAMAEYYFIQVGKGL
ncbi:MAG TPA: cytochrome c biogenesis protein CcdA [Gemmatimonadales bacterium]|nr:cytochrome c biogenesis protein CcdA [Gemmatimonadales bacterium]